VPKSRLFFVPLPATEKLLAFASLMFADEALLEFLQPVIENRHFFSMIVRSTPGLVVST
jgi:hypothetical protein